MRDLLELGWSEREGNPCLCLRGEMDLSNADALRADKVVCPLLASPLVHLDLEGLRYMDSTGLRQIMRLHRLVTEHGGELRVHLVGGSSVYRLMHHVGAHEILNLYPAFAGSTGRVASV